jgi:hypothetical protein
MRSKSIHTESKLRFREQRSLKTQSSADVALRAALNAYQTHKLPYDSRVETGPKRRWDVTGEPSTTEDRIRVEARVDRR